MEYISYREILKNVARIHKGDVVYVISNVSRLMKLALENGEQFSPDVFIDSIIDQAGPEGTILIPAFNWDFCHGIPFDYYKTRSRTGILGDAAVKRKDFLRTKHPLYSFAVTGKDADKLYAIENPDSFGKNTIFDYLHGVHAKALVIDLNCCVGMTYFHHVEQEVGVSYRYLKSFSGMYTDKEGNTKEQICTMYVRDLEKNPKALADYRVMGNILENLNISQTQVFNGIPFRTVLIWETESIVKADILYNDSRNLYIYQGQKEGVLD